jgi:DNA-binding beta-propeller fold protein YncE
MFFFEKKNQNTFMLRPVPIKKLYYGQKFFGSFFQKRTRFLAFAGLLCAAAAPYTQVATVPLGQPDKWDYITFDAEAKRVLIAHSTETTVVDATTNQVIGHMGKLDGAHGQVAAGGKVYADSGHTGSLSVFDASSFKLLKTLPAGGDADAVVYDPAGKRVLVMNGDPATATAIDTATGAATVIKLGGSPESAAADGKGAVFVNIADTGELARIEADRVVARWKLPGCTSPHGLAVDPASGLVFSTCLNGVMKVVDGKTGVVKQTLPIGHGTDAAAFDPVRGRVFSSNGEGTLSVFEEKDGALSKIAEMQTAKGARTVAADPATGRVYLVTADLAGTLPAGHGGIVPHFAYKPGTTKLLVFAPAS